MSDHIKLEALIGHHFTNPTHLERALTHPSCDEAAGNNQRLEFLGDAVLDLVIAEALYTNYEAIDEGTMDRLRAGIVNGKSLAKKAVEIKLGQFLRVSESHREHHPEPSHAMQEDALEAIFGAIFIDAGIDAARQTILKLFGERISEADVSNLSKNPKGRLQEWTQQHHDRATPDYHSVGEHGPDHDRSYSASVSILGDVVGEGAGKSKKAAESCAAEAALKQLIR